MPTSPPSLCTEQGCGALVYGSGKCNTHKTQARKDSDRRRPNGTQRGWSSTWATFSKAYLQQHPLCECDECSTLAPWRRPASTDVDHIDGSGRNGPNAYNTDNLMALSHGHHSRKTATQDGGFGHTAKQ